MGEHQNTLLLVGKIKFLTHVPNSLDPGKQRLIAKDRRTMRRQFRGHLAHDFFARGVTIGTGHRVKCACDAIQLFASAQQRFDGIGETGRLGIFSDGLDLGQILGQSRLKGRQKITVVDLGKGRDFKCGGPFGQKRIGHRDLLWGSTYAQSGWVQWQSLGFVTTGAICPPF